MLDVVDLEKYYARGTVDETHLFKNFNLTVPEGQFLTIIGSNGSGKTSLLNAICGDIPLDGGRVILDSEDISKKKNFERYATIGRVFQDPAAGTCPSMTIMENLSIAENKGRRFDLKRGVNQSRGDYYRSLLEPLGLGLENKLNVKVDSLSGGQRQALALLVSTMAPLKLLILDEHTAALDPKTQQITMDLTGKLVEEKDLTTVMVTHNLRHALKYGDRLIMLHEGDIILDKEGPEKQALVLEDVINMFNEISIEYGN
ncbi:MAG: ATP-binding cassette domain-containing protein [Actinomycetia bacterium]|nr:ATP-binding cassette domain-containing protein [Actinomycetes bacterium]